MATVMFGSARAARRSCRHGVDADQRRGRDGLAVEVFRRTKGRVLGDDQGGRWDRAEVKHRRREQRHRDAVFVGGAKRGEIGVSDVITSAGNGRDDDRAAAFGQPRDLRVEAGLREITHRLGIARERARILPGSRDAEIGQVGRRLSECGCAGNPLRGNSCGCCEKGIA